MNGVIAVSFNRLRVEVQIPAQSQVQIPAKILGLVIRQNGYTAQM